MQTCSIKIYSESNNARFVIVFSPDFGIILIVGMTSSAISEFIPSNGIVVSKTSDVLLCSDSFDPELFTDTIFETDGLRSGIAD